VNDHANFRQFLHVTVSITRAWRLVMTMPLQRNVFSSTVACTTVAAGALILALATITGAGADGAGLGHVPASLADSRQSVRASVVAAWVQFEWSMFRRVRVTGAVVSVSFVIS
jgi:hypothetical protein